MKLDKKTIIISLVIIAAVLLYMYRDSLMALFKRPEPAPDAPPKVYGGSGSPPPVGIIDGDTVFAKGAAIGWDEKRSKAIRKYNNGDRIGTVWGSEKNDFVPVMTTSGIIWVYKKYLKK